MAKTKTVYICQSCGAKSPKWQGKCFACGEWNTMQEEIIESAPQKSWKPESSEKSKKPRALKDINFEENFRIKTPDDELNRVLGGGIVPGSLILLGGEPGIGKSTLMLQLAMQLSAQTILYISGEESEQQIKIRSERIATETDNCFVLTETSVDQLLRQIEDLSPDLLIVDSIQTLTSSSVDSAAGSVTQVRECTSALLQYAKETETPVFLVGHITKEGMLAGPKVMEHMVDTVLHFEGDRHLSYRILRTIKNRFGSTSELGIYEMINTGLRQVTNPSEILIVQRDENLSGIAVGATIEGNRPLLIETQALVSPATYGNPQRSGTGFDMKRLNMLLAVLEKRGGFRLGIQDVFMNIAGGLKVEDPALDLAVCLSVISSYEEIPIPNTVCFAGEIGLGGEIRAVNRIENRIAEAERLGFQKIFISKYNQKGIDKGRFSINIYDTAELGEVAEELFG